MPSSEAVPSSKTTLTAERKQSIPARKAKDSNSASPAQPISRNSQADIPIKITQQTQEVSLRCFTGGAVDPRTKSLVRRADRRTKVTGQQLSEQDHHNIAIGRGAPGAGQDVLGSLRKVLKEDVLYLLIAEIPSPQETAGLVGMERQAAT